MSPALASPASKRALGMAVFLAILAALPFMLGRYPLYLLELAGIGIVLALGLNLFAGYCGQINFGGAGFYGLGAYAFVLFQTRLGVPFWLALPLALAVTAVASLVVGLPLLRLRHHTLALGTFAFAYVTYLIFNAWQDLTGGENGISVPGLSLLGLPLGSLFTYYLVAAFGVLTYLFCHLLAASRVGRAMRAVRDDEQAATANGVDAPGYIRLAFVLSSVLLGLGGVLFSLVSGWVSSSSFGLWTNVVIVLMVVVGGAGSNPGAVLGGALIMLLPQFLSASPHYHPLIYGVLLALTLRFMPRGIYGFLEDVWMRLRNGRGGAAVAGLAPGLARQSIEPQPRQLEEEA